MPQGGRKTPFSGKAKKEQLKAKRTRKVNLHTSTKHPQDSDGEDGDNRIVQKINYQPGAAGRDKNRYVLQFKKESAEKIIRRKELARQSLKSVSEEELEVNIEAYFPKELDFPKRPPWSFDMSRENLEARENRYFREYVNEIEKNFSYEDLSFFELNLETWRQLWRVLEMSDIVLLIVDIRFPVLMFPPSLYEYVKSLNKDMILVLNKIDLAPASLVVAWKYYFKEKFPDLHVVMFTTMPEYNLMGKNSDRGGLQIRRRKGRLRLAAEGTQMLYDVCSSIVEGSVDLSTWHQKIQEELSREYEDESVEIGEVEYKKTDTDFYEHKKYNNGILTVGCVGQPNVGKSSLINAIMGKKVVSVSRTPGHTKHFQTIFLTQNVRLCDCPGLVFPSRVPRQLQVLIGSFPIAQVQEPFTVVQFLAERLDMPKLLRIEHPENDEEWSAMDVCDGWAKKRGFLTARAARLDSYRAANNILRMALDGKICLCLRPPSYAKNKETWESHAEIKTVRWVQAKSENEEAASAYFDKSDDLTSEDENESNSEQNEGTSSTDEKAAVSSNKFTCLTED